MEIMLANEKLLNNLLLFSGNNSSHNSKGNNLPRSCPALLACDYIAPLTFHLALSATWGKARTSPFPPTRGDMGVCLPFLLSKG